MVIDGRTLSWEQFGQAPAAYEGWNFRLLIEDRVVEGLPEADIIDIAQRRSRPSAQDP